MSLASALARIGQIETAIAQLAAPPPASPPAAAATAAQPFAAQLADAQAPVRATSTGVATAGRLVPAGARLSWQRIDQGQDLVTDPGGPLLALGDGYVKQIASDPNGFGPDYPVVHFTTGPLAGRDVYYGHTHSALAAGARFTAGQVISHTGRSGVGNATEGGWAEVGFWPPGDMSAGSSIAPILHGA